MRSPSPIGCVVALLATLLSACDDGDPTPQPDARPADMQLDAAPADAVVLDAAPLDAAPLDAAPLDAAPDLDLATVDMRAPDVSVPDMTRLDMAIDMAPLDRGPPDMAPVDLGPDLDPPDRGPAPEQACFDLVDNDGDGRIDCADPDCRPRGACFDHPEDCENGVDDNGDNWADCDDVLCLDVCPPAGDPPVDAAAIQARFDQVCTQCHAGAQPAARLDLTAFEATTVNVRSTQVDGFRIVPGDRQSSYLWRKMAYSYRTFEGGGGEGMPPVDALDASFVDRFGDWIDAQ